MATIRATNAVQLHKTVADPIAAYNSMKPLWDKSRAVCSGERFVKTYDGVIDVIYFSNLLLPFSPSMSQQQYDFYKAEAELPGITSQYAKMLVGGLLRKQPNLELPDNMPPEAKTWILDAFSQDGAPLSSFLDRALWEEMQTSRAWVYVDYPVVTNAEDLTREEALEIKPYPVLLKAESVINWKMATDSKGQQQLVMLCVRCFEESFEKNEFHPEYLDTVYVHELVEGLYQIRKFQKAAGESAVPVVAGQVVTKYDTNTAPTFDLVETNQNILMNGERLNIIPAWPLNGAIEPIEPVLIPIIDREIGLYNKISRRNHLLYGASTYTPVITSDMADDEFETIVSGGLGSWIRLRAGDTATVLETPTGALADMQVAIASTIEDMAKMGIRMLSPDTMQSGVALEIRNAAQTAQLGTLNTKVSNQMTDIITFMLNWRYGLEITTHDVQFTMSADFDSTPLDSNYIRLIGEWYQAGLIPRSVFLTILKQNEIVASEYDDEEGQLEMNQDELLNVAKSIDTQSYQAKLQQESGLDPATGLPFVEPPDPTLQG